MKNKTGAVIGLVIIVAALAFCAFTFKGSLMNLVPFTEAKADTDATVQIMGAPVQGTMLYDNDAHALRFAMTDGNGETMPVVFHGPKPEDLDSAMSKAAKITAQGTYDPRQQVFEADNLLVKCPSKYQGTTGTERHYGSS